MQRAVLSSSEDEAEVKDPKVEIEREKENEPSNGEEQEVQESNTSSPPAKKKSRKKKCLKTNDEGAEKHDKRGEGSLEKTKKSPGAKKSQKTKKPQDKESPTKGVDNEDEKKPPSTAQKNPKSTEKNNAFAGFFIGKTGLEAQQERKEQDQY